MIDYFRQIPARPRPTNFVIDFEKATENAIRGRHDRTQIHGCYFHFTQSVWKNIVQCEKYF